MAKDLNRHLLQDILIVNKHMLNITYHYGNDKLKTMT